MRLTTRLLLGLVLGVSLMLAAVVGVLDRRLYARVGEQQVAQLQSEARLLAAQWTNPAAADAIADAAGRATGHRVTLIGANGVVLGDSEFDSLRLQALENHRSRPEVRDALARGSGQARRVSASAGDEELYVAVRMPLGISRVSVRTRAVEELFTRSRLDILFVGIGAIVAVTGFGWFFSRSITRPIIALRDVAQALAAGDLSRRPALSAPGEVGDLARAVHRLAEQLGARLATLEAEESLLTELFDSLTEGAIAVDASRQVMRINDVGRVLANVDGEVPFPVDRLPDDPELRSALQRALSGQVVEAREVVLHGRAVSLVARPLTDGGAVLAMYDLTPIRKLEQVRRDFVANVSHELRTPLTIVGGYAETLVEDSDVPLVSRQAFLQTILSNTRRMQRIVDDLLDLSRIESGGWRPNPVTLRVPDVVADVMGAIRPAADEKHLVVRADIAPDAEEVCADPTALRQVLGNLVENAVRHTATGTVRVVARREGDSVTLAVSDTGIGIPADHLPRIFERFYRVDPARSREQGGTGLGLAIVRHLVEAHGGHVTAASDSGIGTTIVTTWPSPVTES
ncbi:MAG: HAMP domain-containing protein [Gemmatimonadaceae bacterium]|nr:HAMP domain-containing protein [Gemmatimonadaceae bacterium]